MSHDSEVMRRAEAPPQAERSTPKDELGDDVEDGEALGGGAILRGQHGRAQQHRAGGADGAQAAAHEVADRAEEQHADDDACAWHEVDIGRLMRKA